MKIRIIFVSLFIFGTCVYAKSDTGNHKINRISTPTSIDGLYKFTGKLNNRIPVFIWFVVKDSVLKGEVTYLKTVKKTPITIIGTIERDNALEFFEFGKAGTITGIYRGLFNTSALTGSWFAPGTEKELKYSLIPKDTVLTVTDMDLKPMLIDGNYEYHYGKNGGDGVIDIEHIKGREYYMEINSVTGEPAFNVAEIEKTKVNMVDDTFLYEAPGVDSNCKYKIRVFKNFVVISRLTEFGGCFGMGAGPEGVFIKTSNKAPFTAK